MKQEDEKNQDGQEMPVEVIDNETTLSQVAGSLHEPPRISPALLSTGVSAGAFAGFTTLANLRPTIIS